MATDAQYVVLNLLDEIDGFCKNNDKNYYLCGELALSAYRSSDFESGTPNASVLMTLPDALSFFEHVKSGKPNNRELDSLKTNQRHGSLSVRYCDTGTTYLHLNKSTEDYIPAIGVEIVILRQISRSRFRRYRSSFMTKGWIYNQPGFNGKALRKSRARKLLKKMTSAMIRRGRDRYIDKMIKSFQASQKGVSLDGRFRIETMSDKRKYFSEGIFSKYTDVELDGHSYRIAGDPEGYFSAWYGINWRVRNFNTKEIVESRFIDPNTPYRFVQSYFEREGISRIDQEAVSEERKKNSRLRRYNKTVDKAWHMVLRTGARYNLWLEYRGKKDSILCACSEQDWDTLEKLLSTYDEAARKMLKWNLGLCMDEEILECYLELLRHKGENSIASKIEKLVPPQHREPISEAVLLGMGV